MGEVIIMGLAYLMILVLAAGMDRHRARLKRIEETIELLEQGKFGSWPPKGP